MKKRIGKYVAGPSPTGPAKASYKAAKIVDDSLSFHGVALTVKVHHAYPSRLFKSRSINIAGGRGVELIERGIRVWIDDHLISIDLAPRRTRRSKEPPPFGGMANDLSRSQAGELSNHLRIQERRDTCRDADLPRPRQAVPPPEEVYADGAENARTKAHMTDGQFVQAAKPIVLQPVPSLLSKQRIELRFSGIDVGRRIDALAC